MEAIIAKITSAQNATERLEIAHEVMRLKEPKYVPETLYSTPRYLDFYLSDPTSDSLRSVDIDIPKFIAYMNQYSTIFSRGHLTVLFDEYQARLSRIDAITYLSKLRDSEIMNTRKWFVPGTSRITFIERNVDCLHRPYFMLPTNYRMKGLVAYGTLLGYMTYDYANIVQWIYEQIRNISGTRPRDYSQTEIDAFGEIFDLSQFRIRYVEHAKRDFDYFRDEQDRQFRVKYAGRIEQEIDRAMMEAYMNLTDNTKYRNMMLEDEGRRRREEQIKKSQLDSPGMYTYLREYYHHIRAQKTLILLRQAGYRAGGYEEELLARNIR